ncbi:MAG: DMT family transporter, partial [Alphaproteobacteria bacterium]|nr:DMT family transporter [Alphaproteobacteria bacterium]
MQDKTLRIAEQGALLVGLAFMWGSAFLFVKIALADFTPLGIVGGRLIVAVLILGLVVWLSDQQLPRDRRSWSFFLALGIIGNIAPFFLIGWGQERIPSALAALVMGFVPISTAILAHFFTRDEPMHRMKLIGIAVGFSGLIVLFGGEAMNHDVGADLLGLLAVFGAACGYAASNILARKVERIAPQSVALGVMLCAGVIALPLWLLTEGLPLQAGWGPLGAVLWIGVVSTALPAITLFRLVSLAGATVTSYTNYLVPIVGMSLGAIFLSEALTWD